MNVQSAPDAPPASSTSSAPVSQGNAWGFLAEGGVTGALIRSIDWAQNELGPVAMWPKSLLSTVAMMLHSRHPMFLWWGPSLIQFYNDAYMPSFGRGKHPAAMGQPGHACWEEIWPIIAPQIQDVMQRGKASWHEDALVPIHRNDRIEEVYWTYGYSPVFDEGGRVAGTMAICNETTAKVVAKRRSDLLRGLSDKIASCNDTAEVLEATRALLGDASLDVPFALTYARSSRAEDNGWTRTGAVNLSGQSLLAVDAAVRALETTPLPTASNARVRVSVEAQVDNAAWPEPVTEAVVVAPLSPSVDVFVFGISPRLPRDTFYDELFSQIAEQIDLAASRFETFRARTAVESERRNLLLQAPVATALLTGPEHVFELANPLYQAMVGGRDLIGKRYVDAFPEIGPDLVSVLDNVYQRGEPYVAVEYLVPLDRNLSGTPQDCWFRFSLEPLRDLNGAVYGLMCVAVDITEQVTARHVLERSTAEREKLLAQLEAANRAKDEFLATVSHELRTPLTSILGWAQILTPTSSAARLEKGLAVIERNAMAQVQLIEDILDISRIISGKTRMNMRQVEAISVITAAVETIRPLAVAKQIRVFTSLDESIGTIIADEDRLQQVVWNLLSNAVKFTPENGEINVRAERTGTNVVIRVSDTGRGIAPEFLAHVFERFRQDDTSTTKEQAGLGLGLAIVRHLVGLHGGTVEARSEGEGRGAVFEVTLPTQPPRSRGASSNEPEGPLVRPSPPEGKLLDVHVLLVDDQDDARDLVATVLESAGATVTQADSVSAALEVLAVEDISVLVSDIGMPGEDGYTLLQRLRSSNASLRSRGVPALALTAYARPEDRQRSLAAGFQEHTSKPIAAQKLVDLVASLARRS